MKEKVKKIKIKVNWKQAQPLILLTLIFTVLGLSFGKIVDSFLVTNDAVPNVEAKEESSEANATEQESDADAVANVEEESSNENKIYVMQLGVYETYDNVLTLAGELKQLGYNYGILKIDGKYSVFSHIDGTRENLTAVQETLKNKQIDCFIKELEVDNDDLKWYYFMQAAKQIPYEMESDFIQSFTDDEMHIWGYYVTLSTASFEATSNERQKMLLEIYQWLNG